MAQAKGRLICPLYRVGTPFEREDRIRIIVLQPRPFDEPVYVTRPMLPPLDEYTAELSKIWQSASLSNIGALHQLLEEQLSKYLGTRFLSLFNNGTTALMVACQALNLSGEVITTPFTFAATPHTLIWNKITPVFCDIDPETLTINPGMIESLITQQTTGILGVHVYGMPCHVHAIQRIADRYGLKVIYDGAHAFGTQLDGQPIADFGDMTMFSFHATKLFHTAEGGALAMQS
ncbi:MAG: DegT/DnrJ/EryC1/StrS family aminotransferase, partial [Terriglobales bacterium]